MSSFSITGQLADVHQQRIYPARITVENGIIAAITELPAGISVEDHFILPGFIDSHVHIESSMLVPAEFARLAVVHGTVATVSDPHEIANVCGMEGVNYMIENGKSVPFKFNFGAPSCVPATTFETAGAALASADVEQLLQRPEIKYLSEMMNFPGVLFKEEEVLKKIAAAHRLGKPVDGHAPGLRGEQAKAYISAGISTDHECFTAEEALDKLGYGMKIIIREGSAARNFEALIGLLENYEDQILFCSDDKHPDSLVLGHINQLCARAIDKGIGLFKILKAACVNPVHHYKLEVGLLRKGDPADFILVKDTRDFKVLRTYINGMLVAEDGVSRIHTPKAGVLNNFSVGPKQPVDFRIPKEEAKTRWIKTDGDHTCILPVIEALDGQLITNRVDYRLQTNGDFLPAVVTDDILKITVVNRYREAPVANAFIKNFGLKKGAIASSVAHDSHNIVAVGVDEEMICRAVNLVIEARGGVSAVQANREMVVPLPVAGLMSNEDGYLIAEQYAAIDKMAKEELGATLASPFMTLSFMALLVIPHLKLSDLGLFDGDGFRFAG